ncbi:MAG: AAA family ATPase [Nitrospira sp.]|nr:AAA family ATPase [Nitrospira sp.]
MEFDLHIRNIGKLTDARLRIGRFTVFAGPNNTGKSYVSKILYSIFDAMNANHAEVYIDKLTEFLLGDVKRLQRYSEESRALLSPLREEIDALHDLVTESLVGDVEELDKIIPEIAERANRMQSMFVDIRSSIESLETELDEHDRRAYFFSFPLTDYTSRIEQSLSRLDSKLRGTDAKKTITSAIEYKIEANLIQNFQVPKLADLRGTEDAESKVDIANFGTFEFSNGEIKFSPGRAWLQALRQFSNVIYLESPVYWKLKNALEFLRGRYSRSSERSGIPGYFYDLAGALDEFERGYTGDKAFPDVYEKLTGKEVLGGKIVISDSGALLFQENGRSFALPVTAMGVANLGILALLIELKVLDQESFLFIDEPETNLHPAWQVVMAESLFELVKGGVNVVIATHSVDIVKWLEVHVKKNPKDKQLVALNKFPAGDPDASEQDFDNKMAAIKKELTDPFAELYIKGLL